MLDEYGAGIMENREPRCRMHEAIHVVSLPKPNQCTETKGRATPYVANTVLKNQMEWMANFQQSAWPEYT